MAKILGPISLNGPVSKLVELPENFIVNGNVYDKYTLSPNPYEFCPIYAGISTCEMYLSQVAYVNSPYLASRPVFNGVLVDSNDPNIAYIMNHGCCGSATPAIRKITKTPNGTIDYSFGIITASGNDTGDFISQDQNRVYFMGNRVLASNYGYIGYFNKSDGSSAIANLNGATAKVLKETETFIYIELINISTGHIYIHKYNKSNNTVSTLLTENNNFYWQDYIASDMDSNGVFYTIKDGKDFGMTDHFYSVKKYTLDITKDTVITSQVNLDLSIYPNAKILMNSTAGGAMSNWLLRYTDPITGKKYMTHVVHNRGKVTVQLNQLDSAMYTYEMIDDNNWKLVSYTSFSPTIYKAFLPVFNNQVLMFAHENAAHIYTWDSASASYKKTASYDGVVIAIGMDMNNSMYVQYGDTSIEVMSSVMPTTVFADYELETYNYQGLDINTNVAAYVKNYKGEYLSSSLELTLYGSAKFTDTGLKTKIITTSNLNSVNIPVTVYDTGLLRVSTKIV